jgi:hypothetical protein
VSEESASETANEEIEADRRFIQPIVAYRGIST